MDEGRGGLSLSGGGEMEGLRGMLSVGKPSGQGVGTIALEALTGRGLIITFSDPSCF